MARISSAGNSDTAAFAVLWEQGYELTVIAGSNSSDALLVATKDDHTFSGYTPLEVLGLVAMFQARGENWKPTDEEVERRTKFEENTFGPDDD